MMPISYSKEMEEINNNFWSRHGKNITKNKLIKEQKEQIEDLKVASFVNALMRSVYDDSYVKRSEEILMELEQIEI